MAEGPTVHFDGWTLHRAVGELAREGRRIRLQDQPFQVLDELLAHPGELVTREQLIARLWPKVIVDYDTGLNSAVRKLRIALGDVAETPRYIETVPRKGYRFVGTLDPPVEPVANHLRTPDAGTDPVGQSPAPKARSLRAYATVAMATLAIAAMLMIAAPRVFDFGGQPSSIATREDEPVPTDLAAKSLAVLPFQSSKADAPDVLLAQSLTDLVRNRLAALGGLTVVASSSTAGLTDSRASLRSIGEKLQAQALLQGRADRDGERIRLAVQLVDARTGEQLWAGEYDRSLTEVAAVREDIFQQVADALHVPVDPATSSAPASSGISLEAYALYVRGQQAIASSTLADVQAAVELFRRATILDPGFARAYVGLGQALRAVGDRTYMDARTEDWVVPRSRTSEQDAQAAKAIERALELNPALGEAWIEAARISSDAKEAERLYRKGLALAPNYADGYAHYARFLFREARVGEAIETITRASQIDPLAPGPYELHAFLIMVARSDVAGHDRLLRKALEINPRSSSVLRQLAHSRWEYSGEFADAAHIIEQAIAADPHFPLGRAQARDIYLDLGDRAAAAAVLGDSLTPDSTVELAQYDGDRQRAAALASDVLSASWREANGSHAPLAEAVRDGAVATGRLDPAVRLLGTVQAAAERSPRMWSRGFALVYAHTLVLSGDVEAGRQLAEDTLALLDTHSVGRAEDWFSRERAVAYAVLGDDDRALEELEKSVRSGKIYRWWYLAGHDPLFEHLRRHPRFQALDQEARSRLERQRTLLDELRRKGAVPFRTD